MLLYLTFMSCTAEHYYDQGHQALLEHDLSSAEKGFRKASQLSPDFPGAYNYLGATLQIQDKLEEAAGKTKSV